MSTPGHPAAARGTSPISAASLLKVPLWLLALFTFSGTLAMHIFVPALPFAAEALGASVAEMQLTVSLYIAGLAVGQLIYGPLADRFGRRPVLMVGLVIYSLAGLAASMAPSAHSLIFARLLQALGGCAGLVLGRTIVRDTSNLEDSAKRLALMNLMVVIGPGVSPIIGATLASTLGWRSIFYGLTALGVVNLILSWRLLPETRRETVGAHPSVAMLAANYFELLKSPAFLGYSVGGGCSTTAVYGFIAAAPFIFTHQLQRPAHETGFYLALLISGLWLGSFIASRLVKRVEMRRLAVRSNAVSVAAAVVFLAMAVSGHLSVVSVVGVMFVFSVGCAVASPAALTEAISVNPKVTGSASGLYGFTQMAIGALCAGLVGLGSNPAVAAGCVLVGAGIVGQSAFFMATRARQRVEA